MISSFKLYKSSSLPYVYTLCPKWTPKRIDIIQQKLVNFVWNFVHNNCKSSQAGWRISSEKNTTTTILLTFKIHHWKYKVYKTAASHCSFNSCFTILCTDALEIPVLWMSNSFSWLNNSSSTESTFWAIHILCFLLSTARFAVHSTGLISLRQQLIERWQRPVFVD